MSTKTIAVRIDTRLDVAVREAAGMQGVGPWLRGILAREVGCPELAAVGPIGYPRGRPRGNKREAK